MLLWIVKPLLRGFVLVGCGVLPPGLIVLHRLSVSTSFVLAALRALHVDSSYAAQGLPGTEDGWGLSRAV
jgi:hypothetical protein